VRPVAAGRARQRRILGPGISGLSFEPRHLVSESTLEGTSIVKTSVWKRSFAILVNLLLLLAFTERAHAQLSSSDEERLQILSDPDALKKKLEKDKSRAPFEFFRSQVAPFDVLPFVKPYHWSTLQMELRANYDDYEGQLRFFPVDLPGMPQEIVYTRDARLVREQRARLAMQLLFPPEILTKRKEMNVELVQPGSIRSDELWQVPLRFLPPHQMLVLILSRESSNQYASWNRLPCFLPAGVDRGEPTSLDLLRYYRLVLPEEPDKPFLSPHPLTWTSISHIVWDGLPPDSLSVSYQQAMLDWLHWGGQLVLVGGAGPTFSIFRDSFLGPYLPAEPTGENKSLGEKELKPLADSYRPTAQPQLTGEQELSPPRTAMEIRIADGHTYTRAAPIQPPHDRPVFVSGLNPNPGSATIQLGEGSPYLLAVERRVGRGRITMLTVNPTDPTLSVWPGLDTMIRRVVLRRPEETRNIPESGMDPSLPQGMLRTLEGPDLTWYRIASRDVGSEVQAMKSRLTQATIPPPATAARSTKQSQSQPVAGPGQGDAEEAVMRRLGASEWRDTSPLPHLCQDLLEKASGISIPSSQFVFKVILAYILAVVPLNWLVCRFVLRKREWAWMVVPLLALGFAVGVERVAAYDLGYDSACDEIDLLEVHGGYPRAHLSRFASLYSTGRARYTVAYPYDPTALALPFNTGRSITGEDVTTAAWESYPIPALKGYSIQPRSLGMFRAEQMFGLSGTIDLEEDGKGRTIVNRSDLELRDAVLIDFSGTGERRETRLGTIAAGASIKLDEVQEPAEAVSLHGYDGPDPEPLLTRLREYWEGRPESFGELRLVAWVPHPFDGQVFDPALDRHRGMAAVLVHLRYGSPPSPESPRFNALAGATGFPARTQMASPEPTPMQAAPGSSRPQINAMVRKVPASNEK
jgi:hypothetical protein